MGAPVLERRPDELTAAQPVQQQQQPQQQLNLAQLRPVLRDAVREGLTSQQQVARQAMTSAASAIHSAIQRGNNLALNDQWNRSQLCSLLVRTEGSV